MSINQAATRSSIDDAAFWYWQAGISIIPCQGKKPNIPTWEQYQQRRATRQELDGWIKAGKFQTIGIICGAVSGNLVVMDLDSLDACQIFELRYPNLLKTFTVKSGSGKGQHLYFKCTQLPQTARVILGDKRAIELRSNGCYVIAPPSIHPDSGMPYVPMNEQPVTTLAHMEMVREWIHSLIRQKYQPGSGKLPAKPLPAPRPANWTRRDEYMRDAYLRAAIRRQVDIVTGAPVGNRNNALFMSAQTLGQLIAGGELSRPNIESMLINAAVTVGLDEGEARRTIASGFEAGSKQPRVVPPAPRRA